MSAIEWDWAVGEASARLVQCDALRGRVFVDLDGTPSDVAEVRDRLDDDGLWRLIWNAAQEGFEL